MPPFRVRWLRVLPPGPDALPEGTVHTLSCEGHPICVLRKDGRALAVTDECPHQGSSMRGATLEDGLLVCPRHGWAFDPVTGNHTGFGPGLEPLQVEERDDGLYVAVALP